eukprot:CAMPEP_0113937578 /NCGR_PEP_ID=MMETSP1339-20121228/4175_1 /TAXON_ID=94617 /ORGANISM="Fibrocapsa japonica" /LENGTH=341 /DNA_ID=CAMNT_0000940407 /DNA_START=196 /DNA_END=1221 /DNA_ORIENTATION=+ /assembly_acc=CAM_ASM_000762
MLDSIAGLKLVEIAVLIVLDVLLYKGVISVNHFHRIVPEVKILAGAETVSEISYAYPLKVNGTECYKLDFEACSLVPSLDHSGCCDPDGWYYSQVSNKVLLVLSVVVPLVVILIRALAIRAWVLWGQRPGDDHTSGYQALNATTQEPLLPKDEEEAGAGAGALVEDEEQQEEKSCTRLLWWWPPQTDPGQLPSAVVGFLSAYFLNSLATNFVKNLAGCQRPSYYAMMAFYSLHGISDTDNASSSFPSGHSSESMVGLFFVTLVLLHDIQRFCPAWARPPACLIALGPTAVSVWVGVTRIEDYMHFPVDVTAGLLIGAFSAYFGFTYASNMSCRVKQESKCP